MLSLGKVSTGSAAASYYEGAADDYYTVDRPPSQWFGEGAAALNLNGAVDAKTFHDLLDGKMPDGSNIHNAAEGRRGGTDFTLSAPKSVSMQALIGGDVRLLDAHETAVTRAMQYAEKLASYRITENGETRSQLSGKTIVAMFRHELSRNIDPQLHTHSVMVNATQRPDGQWRAMEQADFYRQQKLIGALYRSELALEAQKLGYEVRLTHADGRFELAHFTQQQIDAFSTRSKTIESALAAQGKTREQASAAEKEVAALKTREQKSAVDRSELREQWLTRSRELDVNYSPALQPREITDRNIAAREAVTYAIAHTTERQSIVRETQILGGALEHGTGGTDIAAIRAEIARQVAAGELMQAADRFTTPDAQRIERELIALEAQGRGAVTPLLSEASAHAALARTPLNDDQRTAATLVLTTDARASAIQGSAGTGKTVMLNHVRELAESQGYRVHGVAPSAAAARELEKAGIPSETLAAFNQRDNSGLNNKTLLVLDEAGMVATRDMRDVLEKINNADARIVMVGDVQQLKAIEAGKPFAQLQEHGIARIEMGAIQRQTDAQLKSAVEFAAEGEIQRSLAVLQPHVREIDYASDRHVQIAKDYAALDAVSRDSTLLVAGTHAARSAINNYVRDELGLSGRGVVVTTLERKDLTDAQARSSLSYQSGDVVQALKNYDSLGLHKGDMAHVIEGTPGRVTLERADGAQVEWRPALQPNMTAYTVHERELAVGDQVRLTSNDYAAKIVNGDRGTIIALDNETNSITVQKTNGSEITLDANKPLHVDHGYCSTVHAAQGQTADRVLIDANTRSATANESSFYVAISRARESVTIYTDDKQLLPEAMSREDTKSAALELGL